MELNRDFQEFLRSFVQHDVRFLIIVGYALAAHGHPRYTKDLDVWVWPDPANADRIIASLDEFGFGSLGLEVVDFAISPTSRTFLQEIPISNQKMQTNLYRYSTEG